MALNGCHQEVDPWRAGAAVIGGWALLLYDRGFNYLCEHGCWSLGIGCICEGCTLKMAWEEAMKEVVAADVALRGWEDRRRNSGGYDVEGLREMRRNRSVFVLKRWRELMRGDVPEFQ